MKAKLSESDRIAALLRVSTEDQEKQGESLDTQRKQILQSVESLGGNRENLVFFSGQEHTFITGAMERRILRELIDKTSKGEFNVVMVTDVDRLGRDSKVTKDFIRLLRGQEIRFFECTREYDLEDPTDGFNLGIMSEVAEFYAGLIARKSMENRIQKLKRGVPVSGDLPYGRSYDFEKEEWLPVDPDKKRRINEAVLRYLKGESVKNLVGLVGVGTPQIYKIFRHHLGTKYTIKLQSKKFSKLSHIQALEIPALVDNPEVIKAVHLRMDHNKRCKRKNSSNRYLLTGFIRCDKCNTPLMGMTQNKEKGYVYYAHVPKDHCKDPGKANNIKAELLEKAVFAKLFVVFGDKAQIEESINREYGIAEGEAEKVKDEIKAKKAAFRKAEKEMDKMVEAVAKGILTDDEIEKRASKIRGEKARLEKDIKELTEQADSVLLKVDEFSRALLARMKESWLRHPDHLQEMSFEKKREMLKTIFIPRIGSERPSGIYLAKKDKGRWYFTIEGVFPTYCDIIDFNFSVRTGTILKRSSTTP